MKIFYFTGKGNSLAVAKRLNGELVSIPQVMKEKTSYLKMKQSELFFLFTASTHLKWFGNF